MANDNDASLFEGSEQADHVADQVQHRIRRDVLRGVGLAVAALVRRNRVVPGFGERRQLVAPGIPALREAVEQDDKGTLPRLHDVHVDTVGLDRSVADVRHPLTIGQAGEAALGAWH